MEELKGARHESGFDAAKRALQIAAAGDHGILLVGTATGAMDRERLACCAPALLPPMTDKEKAEAEEMRSLLGEDAEDIRAGIRPLRAPHHSCTLSGLIGGGFKRLLPGEVSLAHAGVLFLDDVGEIKPSIIHALRPVREQGSVDLVRSDMEMRFPARFMLMMGMNACPCGHFGDPNPDHECTCSADQVLRFNRKVRQMVSGLVDIHVHVEAMWRSWTEDMMGEIACISDLREGVMRAKEYAAWRIEKKGSNMPPCASRIEGAADALLRKSDVEDVRSVMKVARTIADLDESQHVREHHMAEALTLQ